LSKVPEAELPEIHWGRVHAVRHRSPDWLLLAVGTGGVFIAVVPKMTCVDPEELVELDEQ
jgi:hypothetical protein